VVEMHQMSANEYFEKLDPKSGRHYFVNAKTHKSSWTLPKNGKLIQAHVESVKNHPAITKQKSKKADAHTKKIKVKKKAGNREEGGMPEAKKQPKTKKLKIKKKKKKITIKKSASKIQSSNAALIG
jgi:hypothetical protein